MIILKNEKNDNNFDSVKISLQTRATARVAPTINGNYVGATLAVALVCNGLFTQSQFIK
jgi:hypothetical protein